MSAVTARCPPSIKAQASPLSPLRFYRRSSTVKAPRKRSFLMTMVKYNNDEFALAGAANAFANNVAMLSVCNFNDQDLFNDGGDSGNFNKGNINGNNGNNNNNDGPNNGGSSSDDGPLGSGAFAVISLATLLPAFLQRIEPLIGQALLGAVVLNIAVAAFPAGSQASPSSLPAGVSSPNGIPHDAPFLPKDSFHLLSSSLPARPAGGFFDRASFGPVGSPLERVSLGGASLGGSPFERGSLGGVSVSSSGAGSSPSRPRSKVMHVATKGGTLVVPLPANADASKAAPRQGPFAGRAKIVEAPIELSGREAAMVDARQFRVRESMRV